MADFKINPDLTELPEPTGSEWMILDIGEGVYRRSRVSSLPYSSGTPSGGGSGNGGATVTVGHSGSGADFLTSDYATDDEAVQAAVNSISSFNPDATQAGGVVEILDGDYVFEDRVVIISENLTVRGQSLATYIKLGDYANTELFVVGNGFGNYADVDSPGGAHNRTPFIAFGTRYACHNVSFETMHLDGNKAAQEQDNGVWNSIKYSTSATRNMIRYRSDAQTSYGGHVWNIYAHHGMQNNISCESQLALSISECNLQYAKGYGIWAENGRDVTITDNYCAFNDHGIRVFSHGDVSISGNHLQSNKEAGLSLQQANRMSIVGNLFHRQGWFSDGNGSTNTAANGITLGNVDHCYFAGNSIYGTYGYGIHGHDVTYCAFIGNKFHRNGQYPTGAATTPTYNNIHFWSFLSNACYYNTVAFNSFNNEIVPYYSGQVKYDIEWNGGTHHDNQVFGNMWGVPAGANGTMLAYDQKADSYIQGNSKFDSISVSVATKTANYTVLPKNGTLFGDATAGDITFTLPAAANSPGLRLTFVKIDSSDNLVNIDGNASETVNGLNAKALAHQFDRVSIVSDGVNWLVVEQSNGDASNVRTNTAATDTHVVTDEYLFEDATAAAIAVNLLPIAQYAGKKVTIKKIDSSVNAVTVTPDGSETIDGATTFVLSSQYDSVTIIPNGTEWSVI